MLLIIALANVAGVIFAGEPGLDPAPEGVDRGIAFLLYELAHAHARGYPVFAVVFGYALVQLANRQHAAGASPDEVRVVLVRRNLWLVVLGFAHAALLYYSDFLAAYGIVWLVMTLFMLRRGDKFHRIVLAIWALATIEILVIVAWLSMWAARRRVLEEPARHRTTLKWTASTGLGIAVAGGLPAALVAAGWLHVDRPTGELVLLLHGGSGMFAGPGTRPRSA